MKMQRMSGCLAGAVCAVGLSLAWSSASADVVAEPTGNRTVASIGGDRMWQTALGADRTLSWRWEDAATSARLTVTNYTARKSFTTESIVRTEGALYGSFDPNVPQGGGEFLFDYTLCQYAGETLIRTQTARVAYLPSVGDLDVKGSESWELIVKGRPAAYDATWLPETDGQTPVVFATETAQVSLPGLSGYFPILTRELPRRESEVTLSFGEVADAWSSTVLPFVPGSLLLIR